METDKHLEIIRSRIDKLLRELRAMPVLRQAEIVATLESLLLELDGKQSATAEPTGRPIALIKLRSRLTDMRGAGPVLEALDAAIADGAD